MLKLTRSPEQADDAYKPGHAGWLEIYGETEPTASSEDTTPPAKGPDLYEYRWAIGYLAPPSAHPPHGSGFLRGGHADHGAQDTDRLADPAAHVYLYFAADSNWRVSEILATVKHLAPVQAEQTWREELAKDFTAIEPVIGVAGQVAADASGMPELGSITQAVSRLKFTSVPPTQSAEWFVRKIDTVNDHHLFLGIEWQLSQGLLSQLGSRVTGGLLVSFASIEAEGAPQSDPSQGLLAKAVLHYIESDGNTRDISIPYENDYLSMRLAPAPSGSPG
jgi:hypothetical protein